MKGIIRNGDIITPKNIIKNIRLSEFRQEIE